MEGDYQLRPICVQATDLVSRLAEFAFRRLSASDQLKQIDELVSKYRGPGVQLERPAELNVESDEDFRVKTFTELFSTQAFDQGYSVFCDILQKFADEEAIFLFKQLGSNDQQELVQKMLDRIKEQRCDIDEDILNRLPEESEEDFRLTRFKKLYNTDTSFLWDSFGKKEAEKYLLSSGEEITELPHAELWVGVSRIWFETLSADEQGEHIAVLSCKLLGDEVEGKPPGESEPDFRVRRFKELLEKLEPNSRQYLVNRIKTTLKDNPNPRAGFVNFVILNQGSGIKNTGVANFANLNPRSGVDNFGVANFANLNRRSGAANFADLHLMSGAANFANLNPRSGVDNFGVANFANLNQRSGAANFDDLHPSTGAANFANINRRSGVANFANPNPMVVGGGGGGATSSVKEGGGGGGCCSVS